MPSLSFILTGRDELSRVLDRAGDASDRLARRLARMNRDSEAGGKALEELKKSALLLAPAAIPAAASLAPIAAGAGTVAVAVAAMGAALVPQISALSDAADAQKKYDDAVKKNGKTSQQAVQAQIQYAQTMAALPPATRQAAAAVGVLKDNYKQWSDSLAGDTMAPVTKGVAILNSLLPKTTGLVKVTAAETNRFVTIVGGEMASPGLDRLNSKFTSFAQKTLRSVNDEIVHLLNASQGKDFGGPAREFMAWARAQGPTVASVLRSVATALVNVLQAGSNVGVGLLQVVDVIAKLVGAVPPEAIAAFLQLAVALKLTKVAALGIVAARTAIASFAVQLVAMQTAAAAAPGRLAAVRAAILALSRTTKIAMAGTGIGLAILAITELAEHSKHAPPDVDKLTTSLRQLGSTGKVTGEAARAFGKDLSGLTESLQKIVDPKGLDKVQQSIISFFGTDSTPVKQAKENVDSVDKALASLVQNGHADLAAAALKRLTAEYGKGGRDTRDLTTRLDDYKSALSDSKFEQQLAAQSMGLFGSQAQAVQAKLDAQKQSTDGLRQSIQALNDVNRSALGGMIGMEASIDAAAKAARDNAGSLHMVNGQLDVNSPKAQAAATALSDLASKTEEAAASARQSGSSWERVNGIYERGRSQLIKSAQAMGLTKEQARQLADQILNIKDLKTTRVQMNKEDAQRDLEAFNAAVRRSPGSKSVTLKTLSSSAEQVLKAFGYKVTHLKDGSVKVIARTGGALAGISSVSTALSNLNGKTAVTYTIMKTKTSNAGTVFHEGGHYASGGRPSPGEVAWVGEEGPELMRFRGGEEIYDHRTSMAMIRNAATTGRSAGQGLAVGMGASVAGVGSAARVMAAAVTAGIKEELQIASPSKKTKALAKDVGKGFIDGLTGSRDKIKSVSKDLAKDIRTAFSGHRESSLLRMVDRDTKKLLSLAAKRDKIAARIAEAKSYAADVTKNARENASLGNLGMEPDQVTAGGIKAGLASKLAQIKQFTRYIDILAKKGLNKSLLRQILNMGPEAGYAYASALVGADKNTFKQINSLETQINKSTGTLGRLGADRLYDSGKNASKGFLAGLSAEETQLEKTMERLARKMQSALRKALGIRSPARAMIPDGENVTKGVAVGVLQGLPHVDRAMHAVAGRMAGRAAFAPAAGRAAVVAAARGGGAGMNVYLTVQAGPASDTHAVWREVRRGLLQLKRDMGGGELGIA